MLKKSINLKLLPKSSKDIYASNIFEKYEKRSKQLENVCLADFICNYNFSKKLIECDDIDDENEDESIILKERKKRKIIRYHSFHFEMKN